ncbi:MAG: hypothetical protein AAFR64_14520 [Pseudomonadota bacterium]
MRNTAGIVLALALAGLASPGLASGTGLGASGSSGGGSIDFRNAEGANAQQIREYQRLVRVGRSEVRKHITCKECEFHKKLNKNTALEVARNVINGQYMIKEEDRTPVLLYLRDRYKL